MRSQIWRWKINEYHEKLKKKVLPKKGGTEK